MSTVIIGCDLGLTGAWSKIVDGSLIDMADMPVMQRGTKSAAVKNQVNAAALAELLRTWTAGYDRHTECIVVMERVQAMGGSKNGRSQGVSSSFSLGHTAGIVEGVVSALGIPHEIVSPATWKKALGVPGGEDQKNVARAMAQRWYPGASLARVKDHNRAESLLIARYGYQQHA